MLKRSILSILLAAAVLAVGGGAAFLLVNTKQDPPTREVSEPSLTVRAVRLEPRDVREKLVGYGSARADRVARVSSEVSGRIIYFSGALRPGTRVDADAVLIRLDDREFRARLERAEASLESDIAGLAKLIHEEENVAEQLRIATLELDVAEDELRRVEELFERGLAGPRELDAERVTTESKRRTWNELQKQSRFLPETRRQHEAMVELRKADRDLAALNIERCEIRTPFAGRIEDVRVELGERISAGGWLFSVLDPDLIEVPIELPLSWYPRLKVGAAVELTLETASDIAWRGYVKRIAPSGSVSSRTFSVYVEVDNTAQPEPMMPGVFVRAEIAGPELAGALLVPRGAVKDERVFVYDQGVARPVEVTVRSTIENVCAIKGLAPGTVVITSNLDVLTDGTAVTLPETMVPLDVPTAPTKPSVADSETASTPQS